jgi:uncharacterized protein with PQ loop repeat
MVSELTTNIIGYAASSLLIVSFLSQLFLIYLSKDAKNISYIFILLQLAVNITLFVYDYFIISIPLMIGNGVTSLLLVIMYLQKIYYTRYYDKLYLTNKLYEL